MGPTDARPHPRWRRLYAAWAVIAVAAVLAQRTPASALGERALGVVALAVALVATRRWLRLNTAALDLSTWCDCAPAMVAVRIVRAGPACRAADAPPPAPAPEPVALAPPDP